LEKLDIVLSSIDFSTIGKRYNVNSTDDLFAAIGSGNARLQQVVNHVQQLDDKNKPVKEIDPQSIVKQPTHQSKQSVDQNGITV